MKKFTAFVLCAFLCLGLTACGSASTDSQKNNTTKQDDVAKTGGYVFETKGKQIALTGVLESQKWTGQDGVQHEGWQLTASSVTLLSGTKNNEGPETVEAETPTF